jgi:hypothetical protein
LGSGADVAGNIGTIGLATNQMWIQATDQTNLAVSYQLLLNPNGGNVGIGTSSPNTSATTTVKQASTGIYQLQLEQSNATDGYGLRCSASDGDLTFSRYASSAYSETMRITAAGNVGIGTSSPNGKLGVVSPASGYSFVMQGRSADGQSIMSSMDRSGTVYTGNFTFPEDGSILFGRLNTGSQTERMRIDSSGNVGIGTSSPNGKLEVTAAAGSTTGVYFGNQTAGARTDVHVWSASNSDGFLWFERSGASENGNIRYNHPSDAMSFQTASARRMNISSAGIVTMDAYGVGTATFSAAGVISSVSDETWKIKDGVPVDTDAMLKKLEPGYWYYNDEKKETFGTDRQLGFYAQNVNAAIGPEAAPVPEEGKPWGYYDRSVLAVTVMSLQKALATIESLTARITALESK